MFRFVFLVLNSTLSCFTQTVWDCEKLTFSADELSETNWKEYSYYTSEFCIPTAVVRNKILGEEYIQKIKVWLVRIFLGTRRGSREEHTFLMIMS